MIVRSAGLVFAGAVALAVIACSPPPPPLPGGPAPEYEPPRGFDIPMEPAAPSDAPPATSTESAPSSSAAAPPAGTPGPASEWTSTSVEAPPPPKGAGDPIPADGRVGAKHLVVAYQGAKLAPTTVTRTKADAQKRAEACLAQTKVKATKFEAVVKECTDEPYGKARGGDLATFKPEAMDPAFTKALLDLKVGQTSGVVETPLGFHIIQRTR